MFQPFKNKEKASDPKSFVTWSYALFFSMSLCPQVLLALFILFRIIASLCPSCSLFLNSQVCVPSLDYIQQNSSPRGDLAMSIPCLLFGSMPLPGKQHSKG